ncbi:CHAT domain-containing protein [Fortiea contorta]|uniref:CHAT domain-containing protein n=1 Tax=Fortiea contorta TaxID=1892405 RepID=UPI000348E019|nr:CHAT domain-containing protein [Fortiea contorta]
MGFIYIARRKVLHLVCCFFIALLYSLAAPVLALSPLTINAGNGAALLAAGKELYDAGRFAQAVQILQQSVKIYRHSGDTLNCAVSLSNLSLSYQQLGAWNQAQEAISESLNLLKAAKNPENQEIFAKSLDIQGRLQLSRGQSEVALTTWQQAAEIYQKTANHSGVVKALINQAQAWRAQGFYRRSAEILKNVNQQLQSEPDSIEKAVGWRSLGDTLLVVGDLEESRLALEQSLLIAQRLQSLADIGASLFSLGNNARAQQQKLQAIAYYQQAVNISPSPLTKVQAQLNHFSLLTTEPQFTQAQALLPVIQSQLQQLPPSRAAIYAEINFAQSLRKIPGQNLHTAKLLATAIQQARNLGDSRAEAYGLWILGSLYESNQQWKEAQKLTQQALVLAQTSHTTDLVYPLNWQLGRLYWAQEDLKSAIAAYSAAVETLNSLRQDLVAINQDVQFNFRDSVEPVYRQSVELLLQSQAVKPDKQILEQVRQRIEALQLAELDNYFREACLTAKSVTLDQVVEQNNSSAAIFYPIILPQEIQVIVTIPGKSLKLYKTKIPQTQVKKTLTKLQKHLVNPGSVNAFQAESQQVYNWLIKPVESELATSQVDTLVFVLDGELRSLPMASLYDGKQYLVEKYAIALGINLQLLDPKPLVRGKIKALTAGLTQPPPEFPNLTPLLAVRSEIELITQAGVSTTSLLDQDFTRPALEKEVNAVPFNVVHLATHGQFSSQAEKTFIIASDGMINVKQFDTLLRSREQNKSPAIELLFLSACQTAAGDSRATLGLAGVAVRAGTRSTLASLWHIDDQSTALFVGAFYHHLKNSKITKAEALRQAQLTLLRHPNYHAPSFWSTYVLIGNWL